HKTIIAEGDDCDAAALLRQLAPVLAVLRDDDAAQPGAAADGDEFALAEGDVEEAVVVVAALRGPLDVVLPVDAVARGHAPPAIADGDEQSRRLRFLLRRGAR